MNTEVLVGFVAHFTKFKLPQSALLWLKVQLLQHDPG